MAISLVLSWAAIAAFLVGLNRQGKTRLLAFGLGSVAAAVSLWVVVALIAVSRPF